MDLIHEWEDPHLRAFATGLKPDGVKDFAKIAVSSGLIGVESALFGLNFRLIMLESVPRGLR